ncbi:MAG: damage-inducible protein, partial [Mesorhizobium sp.]
MGQPAASPAIAALRERVARLEGGPARNRATLPFGVPRIDKVLPGGGLALGALHDVAGGRNGAIDGAAAALFAAGI